MFIHHHLLIATQYAIRALPFCNLLVSPFPIVSIHAPRAPRRYRWKYSHQHILTMLTRKIDYIRVYR
jgi:hypothetical protein